MNVILIPFFLAANVAVNDTSEWTYGPEYLYNVNMTYVIKSDPTEPVGNMQLISAMKCRPKVAENSLLCILQNSTTIMSLEKDNTRTTTREIKTEQMFEIKFNERGVESLLIEPPSRMEVVNFIRKIANQLSVGTDMKRKIGMSQFMARENTSMGNCATMYKITREELPETLDTLKVWEHADIKLVVLPMADARPGTTLTIEKSRMGCINSPRYVDFTIGILKMGRFFSKIYVDGVSGFETYTELDGKLRTESISSRIIAFKALLQMNLDSIVPAQDPLPSISYGELIDLNLNNDIPSNIID
ncbi:uncharacterized protein LOC116845110 isoform X3 [Odontomachus brunneus]|uniref:uncharacterized protein LOC116845110 isoform X1 n=1 Tax=Odontomachus brunneus TaxID=486640 RepID=UPI0013F1C237|nr:uncharacterized protein LOC116845110 isoform X1 [Odontomachus brunneus]XP_032673328.1 uncharacterized protein LOC116845110 isoform X2 [Odontomachus brunneus]XP_032673329.1 uncharacterized protein LOC116845110 isoform X2 [Odontomachus brunneus]XP_032673330.1 uncharacterized protein LOC116845110 isoform X3 [Odontomachus brunneus]